jgi:hypothetical protein
LTAFTEVYNGLEILKDDARLKYRPTNKIYQYYYQCLQYSVALFSPYCYKDLITNLTKFDQIEYFFKTNGTDNLFQLTVPSTPLLNGKFYVGSSPSEDISYTEIPSTSYSYSASTNILTINLSVFPVGYSVYIASYIEGSFAVDLNFLEQIILSNAMLIPYLKEHQNRNSLLNQMVYGGATKLYSQSSHLDSVHKSVQDQINEVTALITQYTYNSSTDNLRGLGGGYCS